MVQEDSLLYTFYRVISVSDTHFHVKQMIYNTKFIKEYYDDDTNENIKVYEASILQEGSEEKLIPINIEYILTITKTVRYEI
jgi:hypothetical protein